MPHLSRRRLTRLGPRGFMLIGVPPPVTCLVVALLLGVHALGMAVVFVVLRRRREAAPKASFTHEERS